MRRGDGLGGRRCYLSCAAAGVLRRGGLVVEVEDFLAPGGVDGVTEADEPGVVRAAELGNAGHAQVAVLEAEAAGAYTREDEVLDVLLLQVLGNVALDEVLVVVGVDEAAEIGDAMAPVIADASDVEGCDLAVRGDVLLEPLGDPGVGGVDVADAIDGDGAPGIERGGAGGEHDDGAGDERPFCRRVGEALERPHNRDEETGKDKEQGERL